ncbi:MAG: hypothetical protein QOI38_1419 [Sphingomonadales bacterium]|jgi:hypothetical protein|nr:hypothetical protein [Sphingomonadales bacterium]
MRFPALLLLPLTAALAGSGGAVQAADPPVAVPFVGCASDGQTGPIAAPSSTPVPPISSAGNAAGLALYASSDLAVLAPRGWHCFGLYGSNGSSLIVTPEPHGFDDLAHGEAPLRGPFVSIAMSYGGTSGRFAVAEAIARFFPDHMAFAQEVAAEGMSSEPLPSGPYPNDRIRRRSATAVEFVTPGGREGSGIAFGIAVAPEPVHGAVVLIPGDEPDVITVRVRLPAGAHAAPTIIEEVAARFGDGGGE